jgi:hypothetical protein
VRGFNYGIPGSKDLAAIRAVIADVMVPEFTPQKGVKIQVPTYAATLPVSTAKRECFPLHVRYADDQSTGGRR